MKVTKNIFLFRSDDYSSNIYVVDNELIIDTGLGIYFNEIVNSMKAEGIKLENIKIILNTHAHCDHVRGNKKFKELTNSKIAAHKFAAKNIESGRNLYCNYFSLEPIKVKVDKILKEGEEINTLNHSFKVIHTPGHTRGDICLYDQEKKILISGDILFANAVGRYDLAEGSKENLINSLIKLRKLKIELLLPGHGLFKRGNIGELIDKLLSNLK